MKALAKKNMNRVDDPIASARRATETSAVMVVQDHPIVIVMMDIETIGTVVVHHQEVLLVETITVLRPVADTTVTTTVAEAIVVHLAADTMNQAMVDLLSSDVKIKKINSQIISTI